MFILPKASRIKINAAQPNESDYAAPQPKRGVSLLTWIILFGNLQRRQPDDSLPFTPRKSTLNRADNE